MKSVSAPETNQNDVGSGHPPRDSIEGERLVVRRIAYLSAALALAIAAVWLVSIEARTAGTGPDRVTVPALLFGILPALFGLVFVGLDAAYDELSGVARRTRTYWDYTDRLRRQRWKADR